MSTPTTPWFPMTHDDAQEMVAAIRQIGGQYNTADPASIVAAIRSGNADKIPNGTLFTVPHAAYGNITFVTRARNLHKVAGDATRPTITIQPLYLLSANGGSTAATFQYDRPEAFAKVSEAIPAGTVVKFTAIAYGSWAAGDWHFTAENAIDAGKMLCLSGTQDNTLDTLTVKVFDTPKDTTASAEYAISAGDGEATVNLGTWGVELNHPQRMRYGSNNEAQSNLFQFLNGDSGTGVMADVFEPQSDFDMMSTDFSTLKGFVGGFSDEFRSYLGLCAIPNTANNVHENAPYEKSTHYVHNGYFFLPSRMEIYGSTETANETDEAQFPYYRDIGTENADKLMHAKNASAPNSYWLRTPSASYASGVRLCITGLGGGLDSRTAFLRHGAAPLGILA